MHARMNTLIGMSRYPRYGAIIQPCNGRDSRQHWLYNRSSGWLRTALAFTAAQPTCLATAFAHAMRGSSVSVAICRSNGPEWTVREDGTLHAESMPSTAAGHATAAAAEAAAEAAAAEAAVGGGRGGTSHRSLGAAPAAHCVNRTDSTGIESALGIGQLQVYAGAVVGGWAVALVNADSVQAHNITVDWALLPPHPQVVTPASNGSAEMPPMVYAVRDVWAHMDLGSHENGLTLAVAPHDTALLKVTAQAR